MTTPTNRERRAQTVAQLLASSVLATMTKEVAKFQEAKGWSEPDPRIADFLYWCEMRGTPIFDDQATKLIELFGSRSVGEDIALIHSEVTEMLEAYRDHGLEDATYPVSSVDGRLLPKPEGVGSEVADVLIRLLDFCGRNNVDLWTEYRRKMDYNWTRPHRHGGKKL